MKRICAAVPLLICLIMAGRVSGEVRRPVYAGSFYPGRPESLAKDIAAKLDAASPPTAPGARPIALIAPHAGYVYSGQTAAFSYRMVKGADFRTVVILGTAHRFGFKGCSIYPSGGYQTPLGTAVIDSELAEALSRESGFGFIPQAHREEHSIEVQVPFIQTVLPDARIVPVLIGLPSKATAERLSRALTRVLTGRKALVVVSTDLSHYLSRDEAGRLDGETAGLIQTFDTDRLIKGMERNDNRMCGACGVVSALLWTKATGGGRVEILHRTDSSRAGGPEDRVVGYLAAAVFRESASDGFSLTPELESELLDVARTTLTSFVKENRMPEIFSVSPLLEAKRGVFVTLKKNRRLRGCIGFIESTSPLYRTVMQAAAYAASRDLRFQPLSPSELDQVEIEISILTPPRKISDPARIEVGRHGLIIERDGRRGLLLPQVPLEQKWKRTTFLEQACLKAGLPRNAWKKGADIFVFEALVFSESDRR